MKFFYIFLGVGEDTEYRSGVGILLNKEIWRSLTEWLLILERITAVCFKIKICNLIII